MNIDQIWKEYQKGIYAFIKSKINDPGNVDDLVQNIWVKVIKNFKSLEDDSSVRAWMYQIANREVIDFYRKQGRETELDVEALAVEEESDGAQKALSKCVQPFLKQLHAEDAELLEEIDLRGIGQKEYAEQKGINYSTLKSRVQKTRSELRSIFEKCCAYSFDSEGRVVDFSVKSGNCKKC